MSESVQFPVIFPVLRTERTELLRITGKEIAQVFRLYSNPSVQEFRGTAPYKDQGEAEYQIWLWRKQLAQNAGIRWGIRHRQAGVFIGTAGIKNIDYRDCRAEISYELLPEWWNLGLMTEVLTKITEYAFSEMRIHTLAANIDPSHNASRRVLEKLQFRNEAHFRENWYYEGWWDSSIWVKRNPA